ncbi:PRD domain-containing protein [Amphibacillus sediminis]|uniref:PRD domain-containing protein n=1 Tax=Amphibacillus sediminis TaxID=360185 RepID=UPI000835434D|nr:PRD domain-containing protein [Amphibacillus sediminis]
MKIKKILNNNAVLVGQNGKDFIWIGTGLGFQKKPGQPADESKIEKVFVLHQKNAFDKLSSLLENIPIQYVSLADDIISIAKENLKVELSETIYVSLTDHLHNLVKLYQQGLIIHNKLSWEIKKFYPKEFGIGKKALHLIEERLDLSLEEEEAGNIAMHLINAQLNDDFKQSEDVKKISKKIRDILSLVRMHNKIEIDEESVAFDRFVTHLRFFFKRIDSMKREQRSNPLLTYAKEQYPSAYESMKLVEQYLNIELNGDEQLYLSLHIQKLIEND